MDELSPVLQEDLAALRATVERQGEAIRELAERLTHASADQAPALDTAGRLAVADILDGAALYAPAPEPAPPILPPGPVPWASFSRAQQPAPPADAPLPEPVAFADRYGGLPAEVADAIRAILQARAVGGLGYADASNTADALAAWARAQQQPAPNVSGYPPAVAAALGALEAAGWSYRVAAPGEALDDEGDPEPALGADVREAMREAIDALDDAGKRLRHPLNTDDQLRAGDACYAASARLRALLGEP